jgi:hypothetical protein
MMKQVALVIVLVGVGASPYSASIAQNAQFAPNLTPKCLHGPSEQPSEQIRREQALRLAQQINRAENGPTYGPGQPRIYSYQPLDQLRNLPPTPGGFKLQFNTDGAAYTVSLKDTLDSCRFVIFSDQDGWIYQALPTRGGVQFQPIDIP